MGSVLVSILPVIIGTAVVPVLLIITLLLLAGENGTAKAAMFVFGAFVMRLIHGLVFGFLLRPDPSATAADSGPSWILSTLLLVLGVLMLVSALKTLLTDVDPDAPPPKWMAMLNDMTPGKAFLMGMGVTAIAVKMWLFSMSVVGTIVASGLSTSAAVLTFVIYDLLAVSLAAIPVLLSAVAPAWADTNLDRMSAWMSKYNRAITITVSLIFGAIFFYKGYTGLWG